MAVTIARSPKWLIILKTFLVFNGVMLSIPLIATIVGYSIAENTCRQFAQLGKPSTIVESMLARAPGGAIVYYHCANRFGEDNIHHINLSNEMNETISILLDAAEDRRLQLEKFTSYGKDQLDRVKYENGSEELLLPFINLLLSLKWLDNFKAMLKHIDIDVLDIFDFMDSDQ